MKKNASKLILWISFLSLAATNSFASELEKVNFRSLGQENSPFKFNDRNHQYRGFCQDLISELDKRGIAIVGTAELTTLRRIEKELENGLIDVAICLLKNENRLKKFDFLPFKILEVEHVVISLNSIDLPKDIRTISQLRSLSNTEPILATQGSSLSEFLKKQRIHFDDSPKDDVALLQMLKKKRRKLGYIQNLSLYAMFREKLASANDFLIQPFSEKDTQYIGVSRKLSVAQKNFLSEQINSLIQDGTLNKLQKKYSHY